MLPPSLYYNYTVIFNLAQVDNLLYGRYDYIRKKQGRIVAEVMQNGSE